MPGPRHDPPRYLEDFALRRVRDGSDPVVPRVVARAPDPATGSDVLDDQGESIGFFAVEGGRMRLSAPHGLDASGRVEDGEAVLEQDGRPVLRASSRGSVIEVHVDDRRLDSRVATALVGTVLGEGIY